MTHTPPDLFPFDERRCKQQLSDLRRMLDTSERNCNALEIRLRESDRKIRELNARIEKIMSVFGDVGDPLR